MLLAAIPTSVKVDVAIAAVLPLIGSMFVRKKLSHSPSHQHGYARHSHGFLQQNGAYNCRCSVQQMGVQVWTS